MLNNITTRWQAFAIHLAISLLIFIFLLAVIAFYWYPGPFIDIGGWQGIKIVAFVDLVLGPLLTLIVFNTKKKSLKWDLIAVATFQFCCLAYGTWVVENQRPVVQVLLDETLYVIPKSEFNELGQIASISHFKGPYPKFVILDLPNDQTLLATTLVAELVKGTPLQTQTDKYLDARKADQDPLIKEKLDWNFRNLTTDAKSCTEVNIDSQHYDGEICIAKATGAAKT